MKNKTGEMEQYRYCVTDEPCKLKDGKRCRLGVGNSCEHQGARIMIFTTKEQALGQIVKECNQG